MNLNNDKRNVCIASMWYGINYGSVLTSFALYKVIEKFGYYPYLLNKPKQLWSDAFYQDQSIANTFFKGKANILPVFENYTDHLKLNEYFDKFLVGCDTLWHYPLVSPIPTFFFLDFAAKNKVKVSYSSSFGRGYGAPEHIRRRAKGFLQQFSHVSVRENTAVTLCNSLFNVIPTQVIDPVFLLSKEDYLSLCKNENAQKSRYILSYFLDPNNEKKRSIELLEQRYGMKCINIPDAINAKRCEDRLGLECQKDVLIEDWLTYFANAEFIITDSFHGLCFALIFEKEFICFANKGRGEERFLSLLNIVSAKERLYYSLDELLINSYLLTNKLNYTDINRNLSSIKDFSINWLKKSLETRVKSIQITDNYSDDASIELLDPKDCTGCGACVHMCKSNAIKLIINDKGFYTAVVDKEKCDNCGVCSKRCIALSPKYNNSTIPECYAMMATDEIRKVSSSGGFFTVIAKYVLENNGLVCGAAYKENFEVEHILIDKEEDLYKLRGSKYIQSKSDTVYEQIKQYLIEGRLILFTGMPCQVSGLKAYLVKDWDNLITVDIFCHGITSHKVFEKYRKEILKNKKIVKLEFKEKTPWGWHAGTQAKFSDNTEYKEPLENDPYFKAYLNGISVNSACNSCKQNALPRQGDFSIGDFWGVEKFDPKLNDNLGTSAVLVNNLKSCRIIEVIKKSPDILKMIKVPLNYAIEGNGSINIAFKTHRNSSRFFELFDFIDFRKLQYYCRINRSAEIEYIELCKLIPEKHIVYYYLAKVTAKYSQGRQIVTWIKSEIFENLLNRFFGLKVSKYISMSHNVQHSYEVDKFDSIANKSDMYYLVSLDKPYDEDIYLKLKQYGYKEKLDFIFRIHKPIVIENFDLSKNNYFDEYGNSVEGSVGVISRLVINGYNNHIILGKNIRYKSIDFNVTSNSFINIDDNVICNSRVSIKCFGNIGQKIINVSKRANFGGDTQFKIWYDGTIIINENCTFSGSINFRANYGKKVILGRDCMLSYDIELQGGDGHNIYDINSKKLINRTTSEKFNKKDILYLGDHVWVGNQSFILYGTYVDSGSIIGARSTVKGYFPKNSILAGSPAKLVRRDITWTRDGLNNKFPDINNINLSRLLNPIVGQKVLVIGGTGTNGRSLVNLLLSTGNHVTICNRGLTEDYFDYRVKHIKADVSNRESTRKALSNKYFDIIFNNIAYTAQNVNNVLSFVECNKYIQLSSFAVYDKFDLNMNESLFDPYNYKKKQFNLNNSYQIGKKNAEAEACQKFKQFNPVLVRIPYIDPSPRLDFFVDNISKSQSINIGKNNFGFPLAQSDELAKFLLFIANSDFTGPINFCSSGYITVSEIINYIESKINIECVIDPNGKNIPYPFVNSNLFSADLTMASELGFKTSEIKDWIFSRLDTLINSKRKKL